MSFLMFKRVMSHEKIWTTYYGEDVRRYDDREGHIVPVETRRLIWGDNYDTFVFVWGGPGPDFNIYTKDDYGRSWAFTKKELINAGGKP